MMSCLSLGIIRLPVYQPGLVRVRGPSSGGAGSQFVKPFQATLRTQCCTPAGATCCACSTGPDGR